MAPRISSPLGEGDHPQDGGGAPAPSLNIRLFPSTTLGVVPLPVSGRIS